MSLFYGWKISGLALLGNFLLQGGALYGMNAFMEPLCAQNGWTRMDVNMGLGVAALIAQIAMPISAAIAAKISLRLLMGLGALIGGLATCAMGLTGNIHVFTFYLIVVWVSSQFCGGVVGNALMSNWFSHYRGVAFGVANSGTSLSGVILPMICLVLINHYSLKTAFLAVGLTTCLLAPLSWIIVRRSPAVLHLHADGRKHDPRQPKGIPRRAYFAELVRRPACWFIGCSFGLALMCASGILSQLKPRYVDLGLESYTAMLLASVSAGCGTAAKYFWGWACDRWTPILAARAIMLCCLFSMAVLFLPPSVWSLALFGVLFTCGSGGLWVVLPALTAYYFGAQRFLAVYKFIAVFILLRCLGFPIMGLSHEYFNNYLAADVAFMLALGAAFAMTMLLRESRAAEKRAHPRHHKK
ncbi:MAG: MFS transporter [Desulfovibrio sp.]|nr:MFS transporter [Desulfovibrio sp.]